METRMVAGCFKTPSEFTKAHKRCGGDITLHWHNVYEFDIVLSGNGETVCNGRKWELRRGMISLLSPRDFHEYKNCTDVRLINIQFSEKDISYQTLSRFLSQQTNVIYAEEAALQLMESLSNLLGSSTAGYDKKLLECMILEYLNGCTKTQTSPNKTSPIQKAVMYVNSHFRENPPMREVAKMFFLNESYFCRLFKNTVGMSYKAYIKKLKLEYSLSLIQSTDLSVTEIAGYCGYETQSHFNREFKKAFQMSPTAFRKQAHT